MVQQLPDVPGHATASPDGNWIIALTPPPTTKTSYLPTLRLYDKTGAFVTEIPSNGAPAFGWAWLPDASGVFIGLDAPQHAATLAIAELDGAITMTGLQFANPLLSRDGSWIVAEHQDGCCASIEQKEIWVAPRHGGDPRVLVRTRTAGRIQPIALLGIDSHDRVLYRDSDAIMRVPIAGSAPEELTRGSEYANVIMGDVSPSGRAILFRGFDPARWYAVSDIRDAPFRWSENAWGSILEQGSKASGTRAMWWNDDSLLTVKAGRVWLIPIGGDNFGELPLALGPHDFVLAFSGRRALLARDMRATVVDLTSGRETDLGVTLNDPRGTFGSPLADGHFLLSTLSATYRVD